MSDESANEGPLRVLLIEDNFPFAKLISTRLKRVLSSDMDLTHNDSLGTALQTLSRSDFDLIVLDLNLPDSGDIHTFEGVHQAAPNSPIVILSSDESEELAFEAVQRGAQDYLIKGADDDQKLHRSLLFAMERKKRLRAEGEVSAARKIQQSLLPRTFPTLPGLELYGKLLPATEASGDYFDFVVPMPAIGESTVGIVVGDVTGHGLGPAMLMVLTHGCIRSLALVESDLSQILRQTNEVIIRTRNQLLITLFLGYVDSTSGRLIYASAGHPSWHLSEAGDKPLETTGVPLGLESSQWEIRSTEPLSSGDILLICTDGILEARNQNGDMIGAEKILELVRKHREESPEQIVERVQSCVAEHTESVTRKDDMTIVIVKVVD